VYTVNWTLRIYITGVYNYSNHLRALILLDFRKHAEVLEMAVPSEEYRIVKTCIRVV